MIITDERLTAELVERALGWKVTPDRFIKTGRSWIPKWRFSPLKRLEDAFLLLDHVADRYTLTSVGGIFVAEVWVGDRTGSASSQPKAATISLAIARALGLEIPPDDPARR